MLHSFLFAFLFLPARLAFVVVPRWPSRCDKKPRISEEGTRSVVVLATLASSAHRGVAADVQVGLTKYPPRQPSPETRPIETPMARFNARVNYQRPGAEQSSPIDPTGLYNNSTTSSGDFFPIIPILSFVDLISMAFSSATSSDRMEQRRALVNKVNSAGGCCLVELRDDCDAAILDGMWDAVEALFPESEQQPVGEGHNDDSSPQIPLRRQVLTREQAAMAQPTAPTPANVLAARPQSGYDFAQTTVVRGEIRPDWISERIGTAGGKQVLEAYLFLSQVAKAYATVLYSGAAHSAPGEATALMESLLDEPGRSFSGSYHRLCRYVRLFDVEEEKESLEEPSSCQSWGESLRSHVDWTLTTAIPISAIDGLEIYDPSQDRWIRVERVARELGKHQQARHRWNSRYVVLMVGAWMELLTEGRVESTLHRVVTNRQAARRLSCPFFMRPRELVFEKTNQVFDNADDEDTMALNPEEAVRAMSLFLRQGDFLRA